METSINKRLLAVRKSLNLSQRAFCSKLSLHQATYQMLEQDGNEIRDVYINLISKVYNVNENYLRLGEEPMFTKEPNKQLDELLEIYDLLPKALKTFLVNQAKELKNLNQELENDE